MMKRTTLLLALVALLIPAISFGAGTCVISEALFNAAGLSNPPADVSGEYYNNERSIKRVTYLCTAHTDNSLSVTIDTKPLSGWYGWRIMAVPVAASKPTTDSDLALTGSVSGQVFLAATGNGADLVDDTDTRWDYFEGPAADGNLNDTALFWGDDPVTVALTNNGVASAKFYLVFTSIFEKGEDR